MALLLIMASTAAAAERVPPPSEITAAVAVARDFCRDPALMLHWVCIGTWYHVPCYHLQGKTEFVMVGERDHRVHGYYSAVPKAPELKRSLTVDDAIGQARRFLAERGYAISTDMHIEQTRVEETGSRRGTVTVEWRACADGVRLPTFYEVDVSSLTGEVTRFAMCDVQATVSLKPRLSPAQLAELARQAPGIGFEVMATNDAGLTVYIDPSGAQRLCRLIDVLGRKVAAETEQEQVRLMFDANTGEVVLSIRPL